MHFYVTKPQFMAYGCFMEDIELGSHLSIKAKYFWPEGDHFRQVPLYSKFHTTTQPTRKLLTVTLFK